MKHKIIDKNHIVDYFNMDNMQAHEGYPFMSSQWQSYAKNNFINKLVNKENFSLHVFQFYIGIGHSVNITELENKNGIIVSSKEIKDKNYCQTRIYHILQNGNLLELNVSNFINEIDEIYKTISAIKNYHVLLNYNKEKISSSKNIKI